MNDRYEDVETKTIRDDQGRIVKVAQHCVKCGEHGHNKRTCTMGRPK